MRNVVMGNIASVLAGGWRRRYLIAIPVLLLPLAGALVGLLLATFVVLVGNFLADIAYAALDPRISFRSLEAA